MSKSTQFLKLKEFILGKSRNIYFKSSKSNKLDLETQNFDRKTKTVKTIKISQRMPIQILKFMKYEANI